MKPERGQWRSITVVLLDGPDFQQLPPEARWVFVCLKCSLGPCGIQVEYPVGLVEKLAGRTGYSQAVVAEMLDLLQATGWIRTERNVVWVVGQLQNEPSLSPKNENHKPTILAHVKGLPRLGIVGDFVRHCRDYFADPDGVARDYPKAESAVVFTTIVHPIPHPIPPAMGDQGRGIGQGDREGSVLTEPADAAPTHTHRSCLGLVVEKLYFGARPPEAAMRTEASIARALGERYGYDLLARAIEGLARRRELGEFPHVGPRQVLSLKWLNSAKFDINQLAASEDAFYRSDPRPRTGRGGATGLGDLLATFGRPA